MTTWIDGERSVFMGAQAFLLDADGDHGREMASSWASAHVVHNPALKYVLGRFVESDRANNNRQLFSLAGLQMGRPTITNAPMNMNHSARRVVGAYVATDLIYPTEGAAATLDCPACGDRVPGAEENCPSCGESLPNKVLPPAADKSEPYVDASLHNEAAAADDSGLNPYIEALGVFWKHYFPEEYALVEAAHAEGRLYYSMECIPSNIQCAGVGGCGAEFEYAGRTSPTYCEHLNETTSDKFLINPHFTAGAILVPPVRPGWSHADVHSLVAKHAELANDIYEGVKTDMSHLDPRDWELLMGELLKLSA